MLQLKYWCKPDIENKSSSWRKWRLATINRKREKKQKQPPEMFCKKGVLKNLFIKKETPKQVLSSKFCEIPWSTIFTEQLLVPASGKTSLHIDTCSWNEKSYLRDIRVYIKSFHNKNDNEENMVLASTGVSNRLNLCSYRWL